MSQLAFADMIVSEQRKPSRISIKLEKINSIVNWEDMLELVKVVDYTDKKKGGRPPKDLLVKIKMLFLQYLYNLSDPELEDQVNDRLSFQKFIGITFATTIPDYTSIWRFRDRLAKHKVNDKIFEKILDSIESKNLLVKRGTIVDATLINSTTRPLSDEKRKALKETPSSQIDSDAESTKKRGKYYFGYKGHIGTDEGSKIIRKRDFSSAKPHDSKYMDKLLSKDEKAIFGDSAYGNMSDKQKYREEGVFYGILDKATRRKGLSKSQKKRNKKKSKVRSAVEHPFAFIKERLNYKKAVAKTIERNRFIFDMNCVLYNIFRANYLLDKAT
ncbi:MAG: IS5 family transposase [Melioribacteraceae bacterium]|nr:IS5 family transposase [Melioribacteraceae bacterium]